VEPLKRDQVFIIINNNEDTKKMSKFSNTMIQFDLDDSATTDFMNYLEQCGLPEEVIANGSFTTDAMDALGIASYYIVDLSTRDNNYNDSPDKGSETLLHAEAAYANSLITQNEKLFGKRYSFAHKKPGAAQHPS
jgi:hypothetical protein